MKIKNLETKLFWALLMVGLLSRLFLVVKLPIWYDEHLALRVLNHPLSEIITGVLDRAYPPGYYTFLKLWSFLSTNYIWFRTSTIVFYLINLILFYKLGTLFNNKKIGLFLMFLYAFSGYFVIFDWQFTMYAALTTFVLSSYYLYNLTQSNKIIILLLLSNLGGLFTHYGFLFYFLPLTAWSCFRFVILKNRNEKSKTLTLLSSLFLFLVIWGKTFYLTLTSGTNWISWIKPFTTSTFFVPFFLGSHMIVFFNIVFLSLLFVGIYKIFKDNKTTPSRTLVGIATFSLIFNMVFSYFVKPILHVRSLQIVGIAVLFLYTEGLVFLYKHSKILTYSFIILFIINYLFMIYNFPKFAGWYLIRFDMPL